MNSLSQLGKQLAGIWNQLGLNQRISIAVAFLAVLGTLGGLVYWSGKTDYALLYRKLDDAEAAKVVAYLEEAKIPHKLGQGGSAIYVSREKVHHTRMQLAAKGIPRGDGVGFEIFDKPNFGISDFVQRANYIRAIQGELARTIGQLDEVDAARVMIVIPENRLLIDNQKKPTASVFIKTKGNTVLPVSAVTSIRFLVANSVEGLQPNMVSVVDNRGNVLSENSEPDSVVGLTGGQLAARRSLEDYLSKKAQGMLEAVLGPGQAVVRVSADINLDTLSRVEEKFDPESQVARSTTVDDETTETSSGNPASGGIPGIVANITGDTNNTGSGNSSKVKKKTTNNQYELNRSVSNISQMAGGIKRLSAAVFVAAKVEGNGAARKSIQRTPEELEKLRRIVQSALGIQTNTEPQRKDEITLEEMAFNDPVSEVAQTMEQQERKAFWWQQAQNFVYAGLAIAALAIFWRLFRKTGQDALVPEPAPAPVQPTPEPELTGISMRNPPGVLTVETLNQLVMENPNNVTQALQNWLGKTSNN